MGLMDISQFFGKFATLAPHSLSAIDQTPHADIQRIAKALAAQSGAPTDSWHLFVEQAETLVGWSKDLAECA